MASFKNFSQDGDVQERPGYLTYDIVCLQQVQTINRVASKELTRGFWEKQNDGEIIRWKYNEDGRKAFINSVKMLMNMMGEDGGIKERLTKMHDDIKKVTGEDVKKLDKDKVEDIRRIKLLAYNDIYKALMGKIRSNFFGSGQLIERYL